VTNKSRQWILFVVLVLILGVVVWRQLGPLITGTPTGVSATGSGTGARSSRENDLLGKKLPVVEELRLADLEQATGQYSPGRDPFRFGQVLSPQQTTTARNAAVARRRAMREAQAKQPPPQDVRPTPPVPQPPPVDVVFLGSFGPQTRRLAVFSDGAEIYNVLEGEILKEQFVVVRIGFESADVGFVGFPDAPAKRLEIGG
jgi:hypothetical protein